MRSKISLEQTQYTGWDNTFVSDDELRNVWRSLPLYGDIRTANPDEIYSAPIIKFDKGKAQYIAWSLKAPQEASGLELQWTWFAEKSAPGSIIYSLDIRELKVGRPIEALHFDIKQVELPGPWNGLTLYKNRQEISGLPLDSIVLRFWRKGGHDYYKGYAAVANFGVRYL